MKIRVALPEEAQQLSALAMSAKAYWGYDASVLEGWRKDLTIGGRDILRYLVYVAQADRDVIGFYMLIPGSSAWILEHLWVNPTLLRQGTGLQLVRHALDIAARGGAQRVTVTADPNAAGFYERAGAAHCGTLPAPIPGAPGRTLPLYEFVTILSACSLQ